MRGADAMIGGIDCVAGERPASAMRTRRAGSTAATAAR
jgi:hypothetical protein